MNRPDFLLIGAGKAGTSSIRDVLAGHPEIYFVTDPKEPAYFAKDDVFARGPEWYSSLFAAGAEARIRGEGSPQYANSALYPEAAGRIAEHLPEARLVYTVRDPVARAESNWIQLKTFHRPRAKSVIDALDRYPGIVGASMYWNELSRYREHFPDDRIQVIFLEELKKDPDAVFRSCLRFLGVDDSLALEGTDRPSNVSVGRKTVDSDRLVRMRANPAIRVSSALLPAGLKGFVKERFFRKKLEARIEFDAAERRAVLDRLGPDPERFLEHCGRPRDLWRLDVDA